MDLRNSNGTTFTLQLYGNVFLKIFIRSGKMRYVKLNSSTAKSSK